MKDDFYNLSDYDYFQLPALSNSFLKAFDRSPAHGFHDIEETAAMRLGKFGHAFLLSPYEFDKLILAPPEIKNRRNVPYPEFKNQFPKEKHNDIILDSEFQAFKKIKENLLDYTIDIGVKFGDFYNHKRIKKELTAFYCDPEIVSSVPFDLDDENSMMKFCLKGKLDLIYFDPSMNIIFDPKFTTNSKELGKKIIDKGLKYYRQNGFYDYLTEKITKVKDCLFYFIGIETKEPYGIDFHRLSEDLIKTGLTESFLSIQKFINWVKAGSRMYPSWEGVNIVQKPSWIKI
jgi:hypothetical protein